MQAKAASGRDHRSLLAGVEKKLLERLASKLPAWVSPDMLTAAGFLGGIVVFAGYLLSHVNPGFLWLASLGLAIHWFGDSLDGTLARFRGRERPRFGFLVDQAIDVPGNILIMAGLGLSSYARLDTALLALAGYHALTIYSLVRHAVFLEHQISMAGFGPTEIRVILIAMNAGLYFQGARAGFLGFERFTWCDGILVAGFAAMVLIFVVGFIADARQLRDDRKDAA